MPNALNAIALDSVQGCAKLSLANRLKRISSDDDGIRISVERLFSHWKEQGRLERHCYIRLAKIRLHATLQMLVSLAAETAKYQVPVQLPLFDTSN